jgi:hypothetical protein
MGFGLLRKIKPLHLCRKHAHPAGNQSGPAVLTQSKKGH